MFLDRHSDSKLPYSQRFEAIYSLKTSITHCKSKLGGPDANQLFQHLADTNAACKKKKGFMGCIGCLLNYEEFSDLVMVKVPEMRHLKTRIYMWDWRANPTNYLNDALREGLKIPDPLTSPVQFSVVDKKGRVVPAESKLKPVKFVDGVIEVGKMMREASAATDDIKA